MILPLLPIFIISGLNAHAKCELKVPFNCTNSISIDDTSSTSKRGVAASHYNVDTDQWKLGGLVRSIYEYPGPSIDSAMEAVGDSSFCVSEGAILEVIEKGKDGVHF